MGTSESSDSEIELVSRLRTKRIPSLRANAYGCVIRIRSSSDVAIELAACVKDLVTAPMFDVVMEFRDNIEFDDSGASRPCPDDFRTEAEYDEAADAVLEKYDRALPWCQVHGDMEKKVRSLLSWGLNDKVYLYENESGGLETLKVKFDRAQQRWTSCDADQLPVFTQLEHEHEAAIDEIVLDVKQLVGGCSRSMYEAEHLLIDGEAHGWICFFDESLAIVTDSHAILLWSGFDSWYG